MRRHVAVAAAVLAGLTGEWIGHGLAYFRVAGAAGLRAGLGGGVHGYMVPVGLALLVLGTVGAAAWARAWLALGRRLDLSAAALRRVLGSGHPSAAVAPAAPPSRAARYLALAVPLALLQSCLYVFQENLERVVAGGAAPGAAPLLDGGGAAALIQAAVAAVMAGVLVLAFGLLRRRSDRVAGVERAIARLSARLRRVVHPTCQPLGVDVRPARLLLGAALWNRPPPAAAAA